MAKKGNRSKVHLIWQGQSTHCGRGMNFISLQKVLSLTAFPEYATCEDCLKIYNSTENRTVLC